MDLKTLESYVPWHVGKPTREILSNFSGILVSHMPHIHSLIHQPLIGLRFLLFVILLCMINFSWYDLFLFVEILLHYCNLNSLVYCQFKFQKKYVGIIVVCTTTILKAIYCLRNPITGIKPYRCKSYSSLLEHIYFLLLFCDKL